MSVRTLSQRKYTTSNYNQSPAIISTGLVVRLDAGVSTSYPGTGTTWTNIGSGGSTYNATLSNMTYSSTGGGSFALNGSNSSTSITRPVEDDFTIMCWFLTSSSDGTAAQWYQGRGLVDGEVGGVSNDFGTAIGAGKIMFGTGNPDSTLVSTGTYNDNKWHCLAATRVKSTGARVLYANGASVASGNGNTNSLNGPTTLSIGRTPGASYFTGSIAVVLIYNIALSAGQVNNNYQVQKARFS